VAILLLVDVIRFQPWMLLPLNAAMFVFVATMAHVIVVHRAMDVRLVVRQGMQYLLARGTIRAIQFGLSAAIVIALGLRRGPFASSPGGIQTLLVGVGLIAIFQISRGAEHLGRWVDRRFFRDAYDAEQILSHLSNQVRTVIETKPLLQMVGDQISSALHVPRVAILLQGGGALEPAYAVGYSALPRVPMPEKGFTEDAARAIRTTLDAELVLPLSSNRALIGVMGLGPKRSEEPFTSSDRRLLDAVAAQTGLALENSRLAAEIATEIANREKAKREIEIAREVQQRLFPQEYPPVPGIVYAGACRPALGVGGDYYDFIPVSASELGIAIGDVSGKGIPAALLMATLRAYVRAQSASGGSNLADLMTHLNRLVYESSPSNRYATLFYGQYDARTGELRYVNAGHNAPILLKPSGEVIRLAVGGPVVGLLETCAYERGSVTIGCGDVLVAFTDGVSEAMNAADEEWGEERLLETIGSSPLPPAPLIDSILQAADRFVAGAPQHDDMTLVVLQRLAR
jgi:sigma-B regulation protein RsbU (phosphoserine phosphatase)